MGQHRIDKTFGDSYDQLGSLRTFLGLWITNDFDEMISLGESLVRDHQSSEMSIDALLKKYELDEC